MKSKKDCKLTFWKISKMAEDALWAERFYLDMGLYDEARRYANIWHRLFKAMVNPHYYFDKSKKPTT